MPSTTSKISTPAQGPACTPPTATLYDAWASYTNRNLQVPLWMSGAILPPATETAVDEGPISSKAASSQAISSEAGGGGGNPSPVTSFICCSTQQPDPGQNINTGWCVCSGSTFTQQITDSPPDSCAYTALPKTTYNPSLSSKVETKSDLCQVCTYLNAQVAAECSSISDCTPKTTVSAPPAATTGPADTGASPTEDGDLPPIPTNTDSTGGSSADSARCWETTNPDNYQDFTMDEGNEVIKSLFDRGNTLTADQTFAYVERSADGVTASVKWAEDESDCPPKEDMKVNGDRDNFDYGFQNAFENILNTCECTRIYHAIDFGVCANLAFHQVPRRTTKEEISSGRVGWDACISNWTVLNQKMKSMQ